MQPPPTPPPYRVVLNNEEEATLLAGNRLVAWFNGGATDLQGHVNAVFVAKASEAYQALVEAAEAAQKLLAKKLGAESVTDEVEKMLEAALRVARAEPHVTHWTDLQARRAELRKLLAPFLNKPVKALPPIGKEDGKLLGELELVELLLDR